MRNETFQKLNLVSKELFSLRCKISYKNIPILSTKQAILKNKVKIVENCIPFIHELVSSFTQEFKSMEKEQGRSQIKTEYNHYINLLNDSRVSEYKYYHDQLIKMKEEKLGKIVLNRLTIQKIINIYKYFRNISIERDDTLALITNIEKDEIYDFDASIKYLTSKFDQFKNLTN